MLHTDHLTDRELYVALWKDSLREPAMLPGRSMTAAWYHDFIGSGNNADEELHLRYYANDEQRAKALRDNSRMTLPPKETPVAQRDWRLPKGPLRNRGTILWSAPFRNGMSGLPTMNEQLWGRLSSPSRGHRGSPNHPAASSPPSDSTTRSHAQASLRSVRVRRQHHPSHSQADGRESLRDRHPHLPRGHRTRAAHRRHLRPGRPLFPHRFKADEAYQLARKGPVGAYLDIEGIVALAKEKGVDAIHPGYGFLSENPAFARACEEAGITFVGPEPQVLDMMGDKTAARALAQKLDVPTCPARKSR